MGPPFTDLCHRATSVLEYGASTAPVAVTFVDAWHLRAIIGPTEMKWQRKENDLCRKLSEQSGAKARTSVERCVHSNDHSERFS